LWWFIKVFEQVAIDQFCVYQQSIFIEGLVIFLILGPLRSNKLLEFVQRHLVSKFGTKAGKKSEIAISPEPLVRFK